MRGPALLQVAALAAAAAALLARPSTARAQLATCVDVQAPHDADALARIVRSEVDRHPTHKAVADGCQGHLTVELVDLGAREGQWLTARINTEVPHRERVGPDGVVPAVERLLTVVLGNDPLVLHGPESANWLGRQRRALEQRSVMHWGAELYELVAPLGGSADGAPGIALTVRREVSAFAIVARVAAAADPAGSAMTLRLRAQFDAQLGLVLYATPAATTSWFASALIGLVHQRFEGPAPLDGADAFGSAAATGFAVALRGGIELLRASNVRGVAFVSLEAPAFVSADPDHGVVNQWVPTAALGAGVLF